VETNLIQSSFCRKYIADLGVRGVGEYHRRTANKGKTTKSWGTVGKGKTTADMAVCV